jgi:hypothetical protein
VETNFTENFLKQVTDSQVKGKVFNQFRWLRRFGDDRLRVPIWDAMKSLWSSRYGQAHMANNFGRAHMLQNTYFMHPGPYGSCQNHNQMVEVMHNHNVKTPVREVLLEKQLKSKLPQPSAFCIEHVFIPQLRRFSMSLEKKLLQGKGFAMKKVFTSLDIQYAKSFSRLPDLIQMGPEFWAWRSYTGEIDDTVPCTKAEATQALTTINGLLDGSIKQLTEEELEWVCTFYFATPNDCLCMEWMNKQGCFHNIWVRLVEGMSLEGLSFDFTWPATRSQRDSLVEHRQQTKQGANRKGKPFDRKNRGVLFFFLFVLVHTKPRASVLQFSIL